MDYESAVPVWRQVYDWLLEMIDSGQVPAGKPLPSKRQIVEQLGVAGNTVEHAFRELRAAGIVHGVTGKGLFVVPRDQRPQSAAPQP